MAKPVLRSCANGFCTASKDDDGTGDKRRLVLLAKQRSHPILLAISPAFNLSIDEFITKPVSEPAYVSNHSKDEMWGMFLLLVNVEKTSHGSEIIAVKMAVPERNPCHLPFSSKEEFCRYLVRFGGKI